MDWLQPYSKPITEAGSALLPVECKNDAVHRLTNWWVVLVCESQSRDRVLHAFSEAHQLSQLDIFTLVNLSSQIGIVFIVYRMSSVNHIAMAITATLLSHLFF